MNSYFEKMTFNDLGFLAHSEREIEFVECSFSGLDFSEISINHFKFIDCKFLNCNLNNISVKRVVFRGPKFIQSKMMGVNWAEVLTLSNPEFSECLLDYCVFQGMNLKTAKFTDCKMHEVDFYNAQCVKVIWAGSNLKGSNFSGANLSESDFRTAIEYNINVKETIVSKAKFGMPEAMNLLDSFNIIVD